MMSTRDSKKKLLVTVGSSCNNNCSFCSIRKRPEIRNQKTSCLLAIISKKRKKYDRIEFTGGEPTVRDDFLKLLEVANRMNYTEISVNSNLRMFRYPEYRDRVVDLGIDVATTSLHGLENVHDSITRTPGSFEQTVSGIKNLQERGVEVGVNTVISTLNINNILNLKTLIKKLEVGWSLLDLIPEGLAFEAYKNLKVDYDKTSEVFAKLINQGTDYPHFSFFDFPCCVFSKEARGNSKINFIRAKEREEGFCHVGEVKEGRVAFKNSKYIDSHKNRLSFCKRCKKNKDCGGVWRSYLRIEGGEDIKMMAIKNKLI